MNVILSQDKILYLLLNDDSSFIALAALLLHGPLYGGFGGLREASGQVPRVQGRAPGPLQRHPGIPHKRHPPKVPRSPRRHHR